MAVSKRLRFEILKRDGHSCRYCGATAPEVKLVIDHVTPEALGGKTEPQNLITACEPCNSGKTSTTASDTLVADVAADAIRWSRAIAVAADKMLADQQRLDAQAETFRQRWNQWTVSHRAVPLPDDWRPSVLRFIASGLPMEVLLECIDLAMVNKKLPGRNVFRYVCGIAWRRVNELHRVARTTIDGTPIDDAAETPSVDALVNHILYQGTELEVEWWERCCTDHLESGDPNCIDPDDMDPTTRRYLACFAAVNDWTERIASYDYALTRLVNALPDDEVEAAHEWVDEQVELNGVAEHFTDTERLVCVAGRIADVRAPLPDFPSGGAADF